MIALAGLAILALQPLPPISPMRGEPVRFALRNSSDFTAKFLVCPNPPRGDTWQEVEIPPGSQGSLILDSARNYDIRIYWYRGRSVFDYGITNSEVTGLVGSVGDFALPFNLWAIWEPSIHGGRMKRTLTEQPKMQVPLFLRGNAMIAEIREPGGAGSMYDPPRPPVRPPRTPPRTP
jgi:hypothetical protein